jgi:AraC family transcriptional regulator
LKKPQENIERINKVVRYIEQAIAKEMSLEELASLAFFSPFHFQRIFKEVIGETPKQFIKRLRLEEAARILAFNPGQNILDVALEVGFQSLEAFSRAFKNYYSISPDNYKRRSESEKNTITQLPYRKKSFANETALEVSSPAHNPEYKNLEVKIVTRPLQKCVYIKTSLEAPELLNDSFKEIKQWAQARELITNDGVLFGLIKDYPIFTALDKCRLLVCAPVDKPIAGAGSVNYLEIPSTKYAAFKIAGGISEIFKAATFVVHSWLPDNGYKIMLEPIVQIPLKDPTITPFNKNIYQIYLPVEPK